MDPTKKSKMDPIKQKKRDKRLSNKEKSLKRRKERDRRANHVQGMFSEAMHEQKKESVEAPASAEVVFSDHEDEMIEEDEDVLRHELYNSENDYWHDDNDNALRRAGG
tara:strand:- start:685 stop:1008 length:324 start_codon:yes stop_codon:yes gene_type:complete